MYYSSMNFYDGSFKVLHRTYHRYDIVLQSFKRLCTECSHCIRVLKYVYISQARDIFVNLALEDWLYQNYDFSEQQILLLWRNTPAVVIGLHQNPWLEANIQQKDGSKLVLARRNSGGGAVYHDIQNLNLSFLTDRNQYNRKHNLNVITKSIKEEWGTDCKINSREDIMFNKHKISGTASKLSKKNAYHHCTLLVDSNKTFMSAALHPYDKKIVTNSTRSKPSPVMNLRELDSTVNVDRLMTVVGLQYLATPPYMTSDQFKSFVEPKGFIFVSPEEKYFPGINKNIEQFRSWDWIFGRTPKFKINISFSLFELSNSFSNFTDVINIEIQIENAIIKNINVDFPLEFTSTITNDELKNTMRVFYGQPYSENFSSMFKKHLFCVLKEKLST